MSNVEKKARQFGALKMHFAFHFISFRTIENVLLNFGQKIKHGTNFLIERASFRSYFNYYTAYAYLSSLFAKIFDYVGEQNVFLESSSYLLYFKMSILLQFLYLQRHVSYFNRRL